MKDHEKRVLDSMDANCASLHCLFDLDHHVNLVSHVNASPLHNIIDFQTYITSISMFSVAHKGQLRVVLELQVQLIYDLSKIPSNMSRDVID
jgi:hypothetical protein